MAAVELENPARDVVEEIPVVGHGDDRALIVAQMAFEPGHRLGVEVVGRLVKQQDVGFGQQEPAERHAAALAARKDLDRRVGRRTTQRIHRQLEAVVEVPGVVLFKEFLEFRLLLDQGIEIGIRL